MKSVKERKESGNHYYNGEQIQRQSNDRLKWKYKPVTGETKPCGTYDDSCY